MGDVVSISHREENLGTPSSYSYHELLKIKEMLKECFDHLGGLSSIAMPESMTVIKVNAGFNGPPGVYTTDPRVIEALILLLKEELRAKEIIIAENSASSHMLEEIGIGASTMECYEACGIMQIANRQKVKLIALEDDDHEKVEIPNARVMTQCLIPKTILNAETLIYVPHLKTHMACGVTLNIKLTQGVIPTYEKKRFHNKNLSAKLLDLLKVVKPHISIIDGLWAMQGQGPTSPFHEDLIKDMNVILAGTNPVAVDMVGAMIIGFDPDEIPVLAMAAKDGIAGSSLDKISIVGYPFYQVSRKFRRPDMRLKGVYPNVFVYQGEACEGCISHLRIYLDQLFAMGILKDLKKPINIILGKGGPVPDKLESPVLVVGDCAEEYRDWGLYVGGCCPLSHIFYGLLEQISSLCDLEKYKFDEEDSILQKGMVI